MDFNINAPIGYSKVSLPPSKFHKTQTPRFISKVNIAGLPPEVARAVALFLDQHACRALALTCKSLYALCLPRLYEEIVVDAAYSQFSKEYSDSGTYVNLVWSLRRLLSVKTPAAALVRRLWVRSMPDSASFDVLPMSDSWAAFLGNLVHLEELVWEPARMPGKLMATAPFSQSLRRLELNLNQADDWCGPQFVNLDVLRVRPFCSLRRMRKLLSDIAVPLRLAKLALLGLSRHGDRGLAAALSAEELGRLLDTRRHDGAGGAAPVDAAFLATLGKFGVFSCLSTLCLCGVVVADSDGDILCNSVNLANLRCLVLQEVATFVDGDGPLFLARILPGLALQELFLDVRETHRNSVSDFLLSQPQLRALDLVVRENHVQDARVDSVWPDHLLAIAAMVFLTGLLIDVRHDNGFCEYNVPLPAAVISAARNFVELTSLRLLAGGDSAFTHDLVSTVGELGKLRFLHVYGAQAGGAPNLGLGMVHPNVHDEWFKVQHMALLYSGTQRNLAYVRINDCVFETADDGAVVPRDGINGWFETRTRVTPFGGY